jgi:type II secretory pathway pseudopilin PulG
LVVSALLLGMAAKGLTLLDQSKADQLVLQVRQMESLLNEYRRTHQRWPGDCDGNGRIDSTALEFISISASSESAKAARAARFDYASTTPVASTGVANGYGEVTAVSGNGCPAALAAAYIGTGATTGEESSTFISDFNVPYNDLKLAGLLSAAQPNRIAATHGAGDFMAITKLYLASAPGDSDEFFNAIVLFNVPVSFARKLAVAIDGFDGADAYKGRVRRVRLDGSGFQTTWLNNGLVTNETQDSMITVAYFFDQLPLPLTY